MTVTRNRNGASLLLALVIALAGCASNDPAVLAGEERSATSAVRPFDPAWFRDPRRMHAALFFLVEAGELRLVPTPAESRPGDMPHRISQSERATVSYLDGAGEVLGRYIVEDPLLARSCAVPGRAPGAVNTVVDGSLEILVPADERIATLELRVADEARRFDVRRQMSGIVRRR